MNWFWEIISDPTQMEIIKGLLEKCLLLVTSGESDSRILPYVGKGLWSVSKSFPTYCLDLTFVFPIGKAEQVLLASWNVQRNGN